MTLIDICDSCKKKNLNPPNHNWSYYESISYGFVSCGDIECDKKINDLILEDELSKKTFNNFEIVDNDSLNILVPRSNGDFTPGKINNEIKFGKLTLFTRKHIPIINVYFSTSLGLQEKYCDYNILANCNLHLPYIDLKYRQGTSISIKKKFLKYKKQFSNNIVLFNKATRIVLYGHLKENNSYFNILPYELISKIFKFYFNLT